MADQVKENDQKRVIVPKATEGKDQPLLVLGGAGYIGSHVVRDLIENDRKCVVVDNLSLGFQLSIPEKVPFECLDIANEEALDQVFQKYKPSAVIHLCAFSQVGEGEKKPLLYYKNNVGGAISLLRIMKKHKVHQLVFSSTAAVYGNTSAFTISEDTPCHPTNCYGDTKLAIERMLHHCSRAYGIQSVSLRYFNASGAHPSGEIGESHQPESHLIPVVFQVALGQRKDVKIFGTSYDTEDGTAVRDYIHVSDLASAHRLAIQYLEKGGKTIALNLGSGHGTSVLQIIQAIRKETQHPIPAVEAPPRAGDPIRLVACADQAKLILGWSASYSSIEYIVKTAWKWHSTHPQGFSREK